MRPRAIVGIGATLAVCLAVSLGCSHDLARATCDESRETGCGMVVRELDLAGLDGGTFQRAVPGIGLGMLGHRADDIFIGLLALDGTFTWETELDITSFVTRSIEFAPDGSAVYNRLFYDSADDLQSIEVVRLDASGNEVWTAAIAPQPALVLDTTLAVGPEGDVIAGVAFVDPEDPEGLSALFRDTQLTHISSEGAIDWQLTHPFSPFGLRFRSDGGFDGVGYCRFDTWRGCMVRLDDGGEMVWMRRLDGGLWSPVPTDDGFLGTLGFGLALVDDEANVVWRREFGKPECTGEGSDDGCGEGGISSLALAPDGAILANGNLPRDGADLGGGDLKAGRWVGRFLADGEHVWARQFDCEYNSEPRVTASSEGEAVYLCAASCGEPETPAGDAAPVIDLCYRLLVLSP